MSDIAFTRHKFPPAPWRTLYKTQLHELSVLDGQGQFDAQVLHCEHVLIVVLSHTTTPKNVWNHIIQYKGDFLNHIGHASGVIWNTLTDEFCIFRDPFGFVPWMMTYDSHDCQNFSAVTSPEYQAELIRGRALRRNWMARFLFEQDSISDDDIYENTGRILPGEYIAHVLGSFDEFIYRLNNHQIPEDTNIRQLRTCIWFNKKYQMFDAPQAELTVALREKISAAVKRIPDSNPCFTLSGGLDSTAILSSWCAANPGNWDAVSLVSEKHRSCDESNELDILEKIFPISLKRVCMDELWALKEPELYGKFHAYGPLILPGIELLLGVYRVVEKKSGARMMITGYGGNFIVKVREEALLRSLFESQNMRGILKEVCAMDVPKIRYLCRRFLANCADGDIRRFVRSKIKKHSEHPDRAKLWLNPVFAAQFSEWAVDPIYHLSHTAERAWIPVFWSWEYRTRDMDMLARLCSHRFYDPLFDPELYDFCACIPPQYFQNAGEYRTIYKEALKPLLPPEIIHHPKCQSFDMMMHDGLSKYARPLLTDIMHQSYMPDVIDSQKLFKAYQIYCSDAATDEPGYDTLPLWLSISALLWAHFA